MPYGACCFKAGRKTEDTGSKHRSEVRAAGRTGMEEDSVDMEKQRVDRRLRKINFSRECSQSKPKNQFTAPTIFKFLFGAYKSMKVGVFFNIADIKQ